MAVAVPRPPEQGQLVSVRSRNWVINEVTPTALRATGLLGVNGGQSPLPVFPVAFHGTGEISSANLGGAIALGTMPLTDLDLAHESRITEDENLRFSMPVSVLGRLRKRNRGEKAFQIGDQEVSHIRGQGIELVNIGEAGRVKQDEIGY